MEQQPQATGSQSGDHVVEIQLEPVSVAGDAGSREDDGSHPTGDGADCHIVNLEHVDEVCTDPLEWVAIERCGHRVVCPGRMRFFYRNKRCCICRRYETVKSACKGILKPLPVVGFMFLLLPSIVIGAACGAEVARGRNRSTQVRVYAVSVSIAILVGVILWTLIIKCTCDPVEVETSS